MEKIPLKRQVGDVGITNVQVLNIGTKYEHGSQYSATQIKPTSNYQTLDTFSDTHQNIQSESVEPEPLSHMFNREIK